MGNRLEDLPKVKHEGVSIFWFIGISISVVCTVLVVNLLY